AGLDAFLLSGRPLIRLRYDALGQDTYALGVHRGLLFEQLLNRCQQSGVSVVTSTTIVDHRPEGDHVHLIDQHQESLGPFDFVIAADGSRSQLRIAAEIPHHKIDYPYAALWATGPCANVNSCLHQVIDGTKRLVGLLPIGEGHCSFFWGLKATDHPGLIDSSFDNWKQEVVGMCPDASELLDSLGSFDDMTFAGYRHVRMRTWKAGRVLFVGDAAHPSSPHLGQGVNLALEDAMSFSTLLRETNNFEIACLRHQRQRSAKLRYYQQLTRLLTPFFQSDVPLLSLGRNLALPWFPHIPLVRTKMLRTLCGLSEGWLS
ncbi:MAG: FAD-dependent oxidoreductase, partial [Rubripirellula sp.]